MASPACLRWIELPLQPLKITIAPRVWRNHEELGHLVGVKIVENRFESRHPGFSVVLKIAGISFS